MLVNFGFALEAVSLSPKEIGQIAEFHARHGAKLKPGDAVRIRDENSDDDGVKITVATNDASRAEILKSGGVVAEPREIAPLAPIATSV